MPDIAPVLWRAGLCLLLWLALAGFHAADLPAAAVAVIGGAWLSLRLAPPSGKRPSVGAVLRLAARFPGQSLRAGLDVARRAMDPRIVITPGYVNVPLRTPPGPARDAFGAYASLMPGTVPAGDNPDGTLLVHCLDLTQPVAEAIRAEEASFVATRGGHG